MHHFFGYYDKPQWSPAGDSLLGLETAFDDRPPGPDETSAVGMVDLANGDRWRPFAETRAWNFQQGAMLQWLPGSASEVVFNDRAGDRFVAVVLDVKTGRRRTLPRPVAAVSHDGEWALSINYSRLARVRPVCGYRGIEDAWDAERHPAGDGIWRMDLATGDSELVVPLDELARYQPADSMRGVDHWVNHLLVSPECARFAFLHRWRRAGGGFDTRLFTADPDGGRLTLAPLDGASHFAWRDGKRILVWARPGGGAPADLMLEEATGQTEIVGEGVLTRNGHMSYSPDGRWLVTDEYPDAEERRTLILYRLSDGRRFDLGRFLSPREYSGEIRCDLHPRWSRDGRFVSIDSLHEGTRQIYVADVSEIVAGG
jgi:hypothetical protein